MRLSIGTYLPCVEFHMNQQGTWHSFQIVVERTTNNDTSQMIPRHIWMILKGNTTDFEVQSDKKRLTSTRHSMSPLLLTQNSAQLDIR